MIQQIIINRSLFNKSFGPERRAPSEAASRILCDLPSCRDLLCGLEKSVNLSVLQFIHLWTEEGNICHHTLQSSVEVNELQIYKVVFLRAWGDSGGGLSAMHLWRIFSYSSNIIFFKKKRHYKVHAKTPPVASSHAYHVVRGIWKFLSPSSVLGTHHTW